MTEIKKQGMIGEIITNGTLFDKQFIETLVKLKWDKVTISLDGPDAKTHEHIRKVKCFNKVIRNAKLFSDLKAEKGQKNPILAVHMVICNRNYDKICEMFKLAKQLNVDDVLVNALNIWSEEMEPLKMNKENWNIFSKLAKRALAYARKNNIGTNLDEFIQQNLFEKANIMDKETKKNINNDKKKNQAFNNILCFYPWFNMSIFSDGHIEPCFLFTTKGVDIRSAKSLEKVWNSKYFNRIRGTIIEDVLPKSCSRCNPWSFSINNEIRDCLNKKC